MGRSEPHPEPHCRAYSAQSDPSWWWGGCCPSPRTQPPLSAFGFGTQLKILEKSLPECQNIVDSAARDDRVAVVITRTLNMCKAPVKSPPPLTVKLCQSSKDILYLQTIKYVSLSLCFNGHFPGEPGLAGVYWSKGWWRWWRQLDYWSYKWCKAPVKSSPPTNQQPVFSTGRMPFLSPNQQCQSTEWKNITFHRLAYPSSPGNLPTLCLTTNSSWLPWGRVAMPLISPLMPVPNTQ